MRHYSILGRRFVFHGTDAYARAIARHVKDLSPFYEIAAQHLAGDSIVLDIGANIGLTSIPLAPRVKKVYCFEPSPAAFDNLVLNIKANGITNCEAMNLAVSDTCGELDFHQTSNTAGSHVVSDRHAARAGTLTAKVKAESLDSLAARMPELGQASFIKMDAEGSEPAILRGARAFMRQRRRTVFMEYNAWCLLAHQGTNPFEALAELLAHFDVSAVVRNQLRIGRARFRLPGWRLDGLTSESAYAFVHGHIIQRGCVDDLLLVSRH
jgi:FkbM family methyltransferase